MELATSLTSLRPLGQLCLGAAAFGVTSHLAYWIHGHRVRHATWTLISHIAAFAVLGCKMISVYGELQHGLVATCAIYASYLAALFTSIVIYRLFFHRLSGFPGPFGAKVTKMYGLYAARNAQVNEHHMMLMRQYGDFVRVAPNDLMVVSPEALLKVQGMTSKCSKKNTGIFDILHSHGDRMIVSLLEKGEHIARRKIWNAALDTKVLPKYEPRVRNEVGLWMEKLYESQGKPMDVTHYMMLLSFDLTGAVGYSAEYQTVKSGKENSTLHLLEASFTPFGKLGFLAWPVQIALDLGLAKDQKDFEELSIKTVNKRIAEDDEDKVDILKYFLQDFKNKKTSFKTLNSIYTDSQAILIGATDSTSGTMAWILYYLTKYPDAQQKLLEALAPAFGKTTAGEFVDADLRPLPFLQAVIDETLRLQPPAGNGSARMTPPEGIVIAGRHIPGNVSVWVPILAQQRDERFFAHAEDFIPERWTTRPELVLNRDAYAPFNTGRWSCVGKQLSLTIMRMVIAHTIWNYEPRFAPGEDGTSIGAKRQDLIIARPGKLQLTFTPRKDMKASL